MKWRHLRKHFLENNDIMKLWSYGQAIPWRLYRYEFMTLWNYYIIKLCNDDIMYEIMKLWPSLPLKILWIMTLWNYEFMPLWHYEIMKLWPSHALKMVLALSKVLISSKSSSNSALVLILMSLRKKIICRQTILKYNIFFSFHNRKKLKRILL